MDQKGQKNSGLTRARLLELIEEEEIAIEVKKSEIAKWKAKI